jgi:hypothetical protein
MQASYQQATQTQEARIGMVLDANLKATQEANQVIINRLEWENTEAVTIKICVVAGFALALLLAIFLVAVVAGDARMAKVAQLNAQAKANAAEAYLQQSRDRMAAAVRKIQVENYAAQKASEPDVIWNQKGKNYASGKNGRDGNKDRNLDPTPAGGA